MSDGRNFCVRVCWALLLLTCWGDSGLMIGATTQQISPNVEPTASVQVGDRIAAGKAFANLMQLSEAVLAPVWGLGGFAYVLEKEQLETPSGSSRPVCAHTRVSGGGITAPFTFSMFDTQFGPVYLLSPSWSGLSSGHSSLVAKVVGTLDLGHGCYYTIMGQSFTNSCVGTLRSSYKQCVLGEVDALHLNWTADSLAAATSATRGDESLALAARGLSAAELLTVFVSDYLPQRAWLRTAVPRAVDALSHAEHAARVYRTASLGSLDEEEAADVQRAVAGQWSSYLWSTYVPQLQQKWTLLYRLALATLTPFHMAPSLNESAEASITGGPAPPHRTLCPMVDEWPQLRHSVSSRSTRSIRTFARLAAYMENALNDLKELLSSGGGGADDLRDEEVDALAQPLLKRTYCVTTTYLLSVTALFDAPFLDVSSSVWVESVTHRHSWAMQTMHEASVADAMANATAFHEATAAHIARVSSSLQNREKSFWTCLTAFLDATTPLTSVATTSPSECVQALLRARAGPLGVAFRDTPGVIWDVSQMKAVAAPSGTVPGITRYESTMPLPPTSITANASAHSDSVVWTMFQEASTSFTSQRSFYTPAVIASAPKGMCAARPTPGTALMTMSSGMSLNEGHRGAPVKAQKPEVCAAGTYARTDTATCEVCPSTCSASRSEPTPFYCPGDGLMHGCPTLPAGAVFAGSPSPGLNSSRAACRYACLNIYQAPLRNGCVSKPGLFYNSTSVMSDRRNGGWFDTCVGPAWLLPYSFPARSYDARVFAFVGSGTTDEPMSCRFALMHRVVSSAVPAKALWSTGLLLQPTFPSSISTATPLAADLLPYRSGFAWELAMQLNATLLWEMHTSLLRSQQQAADTGASAVITSIGHELVALREGHEGVASRSRWSLFLISSYEHPKSSEAASSTSSTGTAPPSSLSFTLRLLLNVSVMPIPQSTTAPTASGDRNTTSSTTPAPSSLIVLSGSWTWTVVSWAPEHLFKPTYRVVLCRSTNTVTFYADTTAIGSPVAVDWPLFKQSQAAYQPSVNTTMYLSVAGWMAGYREHEQWMVTSPLAHTRNSPSSFTLPLHYDYVPGMVARLSSTKATVSPLHMALSSAEATWQSNAAAFVGSQDRDMTSLTDVPFLSLYVAPFPALTATVSSRLSFLSLRSTMGLDGVCRSGYGCVMASDDTCAGPVCATCQPGSYTVLNATAKRNACLCVPQRVLGNVGSSASREELLCQRRPDGPSVPRAHMRLPGLVFIDPDATVAHGSTSAHDVVSFGWYSSGYSIPGTRLPRTMSLEEGMASCTYGLSVPRVVADVFPALPHLSAALQYTIGLGDEECSVMAAARGGLTTVYTRPTYSAISRYRLRMRAPRLPVRAITLNNNSRLFTDQTMLVIGVRDYALLPLYSVGSLLHMRGLTEYHAAFLIYMLRCATVSAVLRCGSPLRDIGNFSWVGSSSLDSHVLRLNLTGMITAECQVSLTVRSASAVASEGSVPYTSWPYTYLATEANTSLFFEESPAVHYRLLPSLKALERARAPSDSLGENGSLLISIIFMLLSLLLVGLLFKSVRPPSLHPLSWRAYERAQVRRVSQR